ncbi:MAG TPA: hypothetical protein VNX21_02380 [Candidatus Thermoplasmatota archaeon]|nr:hypothetical protein [Candidatus Thermoplasmatota archaeon]
MALLDVLSRGSTVLDYLLQVSLISVLASLAYGEFSKRRELRLSHLIEDKRRTYRGILHGVHQVRRKLAQRANMLGGGRGEDPEARLETLRLVALAHASSPTPPILKGLSPEQAEERLDAYFDEVFSVNQRELHAVLERLTQDIDGARLLARDPRVIEQAEEVLRKLLHVDLTRPEAGEALRGLLGDIAVLADLLVRDFRAEFGLLRRRAGAG